VNPPAEPGLADIDVSVVIATFNRERQVVEAIQSALLQDSVNLEVLVLDDSAEGSARNAVTAIGDARVRYVTCAEPSQGRPALVRNRGASLARGRYLHFLDDDDTLEPDALSVLSRSLDAAPDAGMAFGVVIPFGEDEADLRSQQHYFRRSARIARRLRGRLQLAAHLLFRPAILVNSACMARREFFAASHGCDGAMPACEDVDLWARIARSSDFVYVDRPVIRYRTGASSHRRDIDTDDQRRELARRRAQFNYRARHGFAEFLLLKLWAGTVLR